MANIWKKRGCKAFKAQGKHQIAHEIAKIANFMHAFVSAERPWRLKLHKSRTKMRIVVGHRSGEQANQASNRATEQAKMKENYIF